MHNYSASKINILSLKIFFFYIFMVFCLLCFLHFHFLKSKGKKKEQNNRKNINDKIFVYLICKLIENAYNDCKKQSFERFMINVSPYLI